VDLSRQWSFAEAHPPDIEAGVNKSAMGAVKGVLKYLIGFGLLGYVIYKYRVDLERLLQQPPNWWYMLAVAGIVVGCMTLQYTRWFILVRALDLPFKPRDAVRLGLVGTFYNTFLPGSVGGDLVKAYYIAQGQPTRRAAAVATVMADRLLGLFGLILYIAAVGGGCWLAGDERIAANEYLQDIIRISAGIVVFTVITWILIGLLSHHRADRFGQRLASVPKIGGTLAELWFAVRQYSQRPKTVLTCVALSAITHTGFVLMFHLAVRVFPPLNLELLGSLPEHFVIAPIGYIGQAFFPAPGGVGGGEAIFGYLYEVIRGKDGVAVGVAGRLTLRLCEWSFGLVGYIAFLRMKGQIVKAEHDAEDSGMPVPPKEEQPQ